MKRGTKYGNKIMNIHVNGEDLRFDSQLEKNRYFFLMDAQARGEIENLQRQVEFELIPKQERIMSYKWDSKSGEAVFKKSFAEHPTMYKADFVYDRTDLARVPVGESRRVIEDTKSEETRKNPAYIIKRKLMRFQGNPIREVLRATEPISYDPC